MASGAHVIDVQAVEWDAGPIPSASHIEMNDLADSAESVPRGTRPVVFYCAPGAAPHWRRAALPPGRLGRETSRRLEQWVERGHELDPSTARSPHRGQALAL